MRSKIKLNGILFILCIFLFEPNIFVKITVLNITFICGIILTFIYCVHKYLKYNIKISNLLFLIIIHRIILLVPILIYGGDIIKWGYQSINFISIIMIVNVYKNSNKILKIFQNIFFTYLLINIILYIVMPNGILEAFPEINFLGIRTRFTDYAFPLIFIGLLTIKDNKKYNILCIIISLITIIMASVSTAIIGVFIAVFFIFISNKFFNTKNLFTPKRWLTIALIFVILITFFRIQNVFSNIIEDIFNKNATLTGRTEIWDLSYEYILDKPILGHGYNNDGNFVYWRGTFWQGHNQIIQLLYDGGFISLILFIIILYCTVNKIDCVKYHYEKSVLTGFWFAFVIMMTSEIYAYYPCTYVIMAITYNYAYIRTKGLEKNEQ